LGRGLWGGRWRNKAIAPYQAQFAAFLGLRAGFLAALAAGAGAGLAPALGLGAPRAGRRRCAGGRPSVERASISDTASSRVRASGVLSDGSEALTPSWLT